MSIFTPLTDVCVCVCVSDAGEEETFQTYVCLHRMNADELERRQPERRSVQPQRQISWFYKMIPVMNSLNSFFKSHR